MTALDRQLVRLRFVALAIPFGLLLWLPSASVTVTIILAGLMAAYNGVALLAIRRQAALRFARPMAVLLLVLDHAVISAWILLFAGPSSSLPYLLYALVAAEAVFRFELWGGIGTSLFFTSGVILFQTSDLGLAISVRDSVLRAIPTVAVITGLGAAVRAMNSEIRGTRRRLDQTEQLRNVLGELVGQLDVSRMLYTVIRCGLEILQMESGAIVLLDEERGVYTPPATPGSSVPRCCWKARSRACSICRRVKASGVSHAGKRRPWRSLPSSWPSRFAMSACSRKRRNAPGAWSCSTDRSTR